MGGGGGGDRPYMQVPVGLIASGTGTAAVYVDREQGRGTRNTNV